MRTLKCIVRKRNGDSAVVQLESQAPPAIAGNFLSEHVPSPSREELEADDGGAVVSPAPGRGGAVAPRRPFDLCPPTIARRLRRRFGLSRIHSLGFLKPSAFPPPFDLWGSSLVVYSLLLRLIWPMEPRWIWDFRCRRGI